MTQKTSTRTDGVHTCSKRRFSKPRSNEDHGAVRRCCSGPQHGRRQVPRSRWYRRLWTRWKKELKAATVRQLVQLLYQSRTLEKNRCRSQLPETQTIVFLNVSPRTGGAFGPCGTSLDLLNQVCHLADIGCASSMGLKSCRVLWCASVASFSARRCGMRTLLTSQALL